MLKRAGLYDLQIFEKKSASDSGIANNEIKQNIQLPEDLHKPIIRN